jgi:hypothetical protein
MCGTNDTRKKQIPVEMKQKQVLCVYTTDGTVT